MSDVLKFFLAIAPDIFRYVEDLFDLFSGDEEKARRDIEDRRQEIKRRRAERDQELEEKHAVE